MTGLLVLTIGCLLWALVMKGPLWKRVAVALLVPAFIGIIFLLLLLLPIEI